MVSLQQLQPQTIRKAPDVAINDRARNAFFSHYVVGFSKVFDVLGSFYRRPGHNIQTTASPAFFSFRFDSIEAQLMARAQYLRALPLVNSALKSPESATLLAVLLLDLFEKILHNSWMSHVNGALALVKLRGHAKLRQYTGPSALSTFVHELSHQLCCSQCACTGRAHTAAF